MKNSVIILLLGISLLFLASCTVGRPLVKSAADNNDSYRVQYLFEHDGCKVYRFYDRGNYIYFTNCEGNTIAVKNDSTAVYVQSAGNKTKRR